MKPAEADERAEAALARFHIADLGDRQVEELSGGQMQRVAWPAACVVGAEVLLADEPTSELDEGNRGLVLAELRAEADRGAVVVVATHDPAVVEACDRHYVHRRGPADRPRRARSTWPVRAAPSAALIEEAVPPHFDEADEPAAVRRVGAGARAGPEATVRSRSRPRRADTDATRRSAGPRPTSSDPA